MIGRVIDIDFDFDHCIVLYLCVRYCTYAFNV